MSNLVWFQWFRLVIQKWRRGEELSHIHPMAPPRDSKMGEAGRAVSYTSLTVTLKVAPAIDKQFFSIEDGHATGTSCTNQT